MDMNDRALRQIVCSLGGVANGFPREAGFDITVASEVMAILCLATDLKDLEKNASATSSSPIAATRRRLCPRPQGDGAMAVLLKDAVQPNLVQTLENNPAFVHGGPFANIAHGCNSVVATTTALKLADYVVTEAGFGADLGAEKFFDIKCRKAGLKPAAAVIVATVRAMKMNGGVKKEELGKENVEAVKKGCANLGRHIENVKQFGVPVVVAINHFVSDTDAEIAGDEGVCRLDGCGSDPVQALGQGVGRHRGARPQGGAAGRKRRLAVLAALPRRHEAVRQDRHHRQAHLPCSEAIADKSVRDQLHAWEAAGLRPPAGVHGKDAVFVLDRPEPAGARPVDHVVPVREVRLAAGAGFVVAICGEIMTMPGLPKAPSSEKIFLNEQGQIEGLF
jgi:formate--tetrahydrofolate ligase